MLDISIEVVISFVIGLVLIYMIGSIFVVPLRAIWRLLFNGLMGGLGLLAFNVIGGLVGLTLSINAFTALIAGFLGIPGIGFLVAIVYLL